MAGKGFTVKKDWDNPREHAMPAEARVPAEVRLGTVVVSPATVLAPMAGVTDTVFRRFIRHASLFHREQRSEIRDQGAEVREQGTGNREQDGAEDRESAGIDAVVTNAQSGCGLLMTEFTSADGLARMRETKRRRYLTFYDDEHPIGAQLFGANPETLASMPAVSSSPRPSGEAALAPPQVVNKLACRINRRNTVSVTPAIGASTVAGVTTTVPRRTSAGTRASAGIACSLGLSQSFLTVNPLPAIF